MKELYIDAHLPCDYYNSLILGTLNSYVGLKSLVEDDRETDKKVAWFWSMNRDLVKECKVKAARRYGAGPVRFLAAIRSTDKNMKEENLCQTCHARETEKHVINECKRFEEIRNRTIRSLEGFIGG